MDCKHASDCGFFLKFHTRKSTLWQAMIKQYCLDGDACMRRVMLDSGQKPDSDDIMPVGMHASQAFLSLP